MRIGFIGNQNNYPFMLARALGRRGHELRVVIDQQMPLDRPESRYADVSYPYPSWIAALPSVEMEDVVFHTPKWRAALDHVRDCDALVLNRFGYDAANRLPIPAFALTTGSDVEVFANPGAAEQLACFVDRQERGRRWVHAAMNMPRFDWPSIHAVVTQAPHPVYRAAYKQLFRMFVRRQRAGLRRAVGLNGLPDGMSAAMAEVMRNCRAEQAPRLHLLMADSDWIRPQRAPQNSRLRVFNAARLLWKPPFPPLTSEWENKGTDVLLKGVALWHRRTGRALELRLVEKGLHVDATKNLIRELGIGSLVHWQPEMTQAEVFKAYAQADIVSEQCGTHMLGMAGIEAMAAGRPVLANARPELYASLPMGAIPVAQAETPEQVAAQLERLESPSERARVADVGRAFVETHLSPDAAARQVEAILAAAIATRRHSSLH